MAKIKFLNLQVTEVKLKVDTYDQYSTEEIEAAPFKVGCHFSDPMSKLFGISFVVGLRNKKKDFNLDIKAIAHFESDMIVDQEFMESDFVFINAPAIAFPFLRAYISVVTLNSGYSPVVLPAFNFVAMANQIKDRKKAVSKSNPTAPKKTSKIIEQSN
jgi:preprotein translocase subunit SecB